MIEQLPGYSYCFFGGGKAKISLYHANVQYIKFSNFLLVLSTVFIFIATLTYIFLTFKHLNGGCFLDGIWLNVNCSIFVFLCILTSILISNNFYSEHVYNNNDKNKYSIIEDKENKINDDDNNDSDDDEDDGFQNEKKNNFLIKKKIIFHEQNILQTYQNQKNNFV